MRTVMALYAFAVIVRLALIGLFPDPAYVDSYHYVNVARALQAGHGFNIDFIWTFVDPGGSIPADPSLPIPSNAHWMPLASLVQVPFLAVFGTTAWASALPFALIGALAAPMTWAFALEAGARRDVALGAGLLVAVPAALVFMAQPDNFSLYQPIVLGALWLGAPWPEGQHPVVRGRRRTGRPGHARPERRDPRRGRARPAVRVGPHPGLADAGISRRCRGRPPAARSVCSCSSWLRGGLAN